MGGFEHIQKSRNSVGTKFQSLQELQPLNLNNIRRENHSSHLPRSQSTLESSPKVFRNFKRLQVSEGLRIQVSKVVKNFHYNLQRQRTFKEQEEHSSKSFFQVSKFYWNQDSKPPETSKTLIYQNFIGFKI